MKSSLQRRNFRKKKEAADRDIKNVKDLLDKSSELNRNLGLAFVGLLAYLLITTNGISDLQLLLLDKGIQLPIIGIALPIIPFARVVPIVIVGIHLNMLLNLREHASKLSHWLEKESENGTQVTEAWIQRQLHPFLFNYVHSGQGGVFLFLTQWLVNAFAFFVPMLCLYYIEYRFADLHDFSLTSFQFAFFCADAMLVFLCYPEILCLQKTTLSIFLARGLFPIQVNYQIWKNWHMKALRQSWKQFRLLRFLDQGSFWIISGLAFVYFVMVWCINDNNRYKAMAAYSLGHPYKVVWKLATDSAFHADGWVHYFADSVKRKHPDIPRLEVYGEKISVSRPNISEILMGKQYNYSEDSFLVQYTKGIWLANRDFKFANFSTCEFINADLRRTNFQNASLDKTNLQHAILDEARLEYASLDEATLQNASLVNANLQSASVDYANFQNAHLYFANFEDVFLVETNLENALLFGANLQYAHLYGANLQYASMYKTNLQSSLIEDCNMSFSYIKEANFAKGTFGNDTITGIQGMEEAIHFPFKRIKEMERNGKKIEIIE